MVRKVKVKMIKEIVSSGGRELPSSYIEIEKEIMNLKSVLGPLRRHVKSIIEVPQEFFYKSYGRNGGVKKMRNIGRYFADLAFLEREQSVKSVAPYFSSSEMRAGVCFVRNEDYSEWGEFARGFFHPKFTEDVKYVTSWMGYRHNENLIKTMILLNKDTREEVVERLVKTAEKVAGRNGMKEMLSRNVSLYCTVNISQAARYASRFNRNGGAAKMVMNSLDHLVKAEEQLNELVVPGFMNYEIDKSKLKVTLPEIPKIYKFALSKAKA